MGPLFEDTPCINAFLELNNCSGCFYRFVFFGSCYNVEKAGTRDCPNSFRAGTPKVSASFLSLPEASNTPVSVLAIGQKCQMCLGQQLLVLFYAVSLSQSELLCLQAIHKGMSKTLVQTSVLFVRSFTTGYLDLPVEMDFIFDSLSNDVLKV